MLKQKVPAAFMVNSASVLDFVSQKFLKIETGIISLTQEMSVGADVKAIKKGKTFQVIFELDRDVEDVQQAAARSNREMAAAYETNFFRSQILCLP